MAETVVPGPVSDLSAVREATCIHTKKIFDSCQSKDCIEDLRLYPCGSSQCVIDQRYFYKVTADALTGCSHPTQVSGLAVFDKRAILFGSESCAKVFSSDGTCAGMQEPLVLGHNKPLAVVEAVDPIILNMKLCNVCERPSCGESVLTDVPVGIQAAFEEPISLEGSTTKRVYISLGQFSILRLERDTQLLIPVYDYCMPDKECTCERCDDDPCDIFQQVNFPVGQFFPPTSAEDIDPLCEIRKHCCQ